MFEIEMTRAKETKGAVMFEEVVPETQGEAFVRTLYVRKFALANAGQANVQKIKVSIEAAD